MSSRLLFVSLLASLAACSGGSGGGGNAPPSGNAPLTPIHVIQGSGSSSPLEGEAVTIDGVVTGDFQERDADTSRNLGGFYVQGIPDDDFATSDGVFVFDGDDPAVDVNVGDAVRVRGTVVEHFGETQVSASRVEVRGTGSILPAPVSLPAAATVSNSDGQLLADLERYEGTLVRFPQTLTVAALRELERMGEVLLAEGGRPFQFTNRNAPDASGYQDYRAALAARRILLDDGLRVEGASPVRYLRAGETSGYSIRVGDQISNLTGVIRYSRGSGPNGTEAYRLLPTVEPQFIAANPRPGAPQVAGALRVASFNVLNFFSGIDSGQPTCGPAGNANCRGADSSDELTRQLQKIVTALELLDADVVGLVELENNARESLRRLTDALNERVGAGSYAFLDTGTIGDDAIKVGFIYKPATVGLAGTPAILDASVDARFNDARNRPVLAQTFVQASNGGRVTIAVNHLKSKGSNCEAEGDPNRGDGQGNCSATRTAAAAAMADWLADDPTASGDADVLIIGDLNAYLLEDPLAALENAGYVNLLRRGSELDAYSFVFDGQSGALDHALASPTLVPQVAGTLEWHINADEPRLYDYNLEAGRDPALFDGSTPYRASDHDPLLIGLDLDP